MCECLRAEARVLILGRTSWHHYDGVRRAAAARPPQARRCARVSEKVAGRAMPDFFEDEPRATDASRAFAGAASSRVPSALSLSASHLSGTHSARTVRPTGTCRAPATVAAWWLCTKRRWHDHLPAPKTGQGGAFSCSAGNRRSPRALRGARSQGHNTGRVSEG